MRSCAHRRHPQGLSALTIYIALLRAVNVGGTGKLSMSDLKALCLDAGFADVRTYIASGNVVFRSALPLQRRFESRRAGKGA
jgi:uncharacterized protein (DUF1697 family)